MEPNNSLTFRQKTRLLVKLISLAGLWAIIWLPLHSSYIIPITGNLTPSTRFVLGIVIPFILISLFQIGYLILLVKAEKQQNIRQFFKIEKLDMRGIWLTFGLGLLLQILNAAFLWNLLLKPIKELLASTGLAAPGIGLGTGAEVPALDPFQALIVSGFLLLFWWVEVPEEMFFRGYIQNNMQRATGKNLAMFLSALIWDLAHLWSLANILERFLYGLIYAFVFRVRQNATGPMIVHPLGNRVLLLTALLPQIWGARANPASASTWLFTLGLYLVLIIGVIALWRVLKLDQPAGLKTVS